MNKQEELNGRLAQAAGLGDLAALEQALGDGADALAGGSAALSAAAKGGHMECVRLLIEVSDPTDGNSRALQLAARRGCAECVKLLIPVSDPLAGDSYALQLAARGGHVECVKLLIPASDPLTDDSLALRWAAQEGHAECVGLLLTVSEKWEAAAAVAREGGCMEVAGMLAAFMEAKALSGATQNAKMNPRVKSAL
jgi:ankyrin repeat protein